MSTVRWVDHNSLLLEKSHFTLAVSDQAPASQLTCWLAEVKIAVNVCMSTDCSKHLHEHRLL